MTTYPMQNGSPSQSSQTPSPAGWPGVGVEKREVGSSASEPTEKVSHAGPHASPSQTFNNHLVRPLQTWLSERGLPHTWPCFLG